MGSRVIFLSGPLYLISIIPNEKGAARKKLTPPPAARHPGVRRLHHGPPHDEDAPVFGRRVGVARGDTVILHCHSTLSFYTVIDLSLTVIDFH